MPFPQLENAKLCSDQNERAASAAREELNEARLRIEALSYQLSGLQKQVRHAGVCLSPPLPLAGSRLGFAWGSCLRWGQPRPSRGTLQNGLASDDRPRGPWRGASSRAGPLPSGHPGEGNWGALTAPPPPLR